MKITCGQLKNTKILGVDSYTSFINGNKNSINHLTVYFPLNKENTIKDWLFSQDLCKIPFDINCGSTYTTGVFKLQSMRTDCFQNNTDIPSFVINLTKLDR